VPVFVGGRRHAGDQFLDEVLRKGRIRETRRCAGSCVLVVERDVERSAGLRDQAGRVERPYDVEDRLAVLPARVIRRRDQS
jgi:hypothetical protein